MPKHVLMQALSPTMKEGTLSKWVKAEGDAVAIGDVLAEVETDKATVEMEAPEEGILGKILVPDGTEGVKVNAPIAWLLEEGEDASTLKDVKIAAPPKPATPQETPQETPKQAAPFEAAPEKSPKKSAPKAATAPAAPRKPNGGGAARIFASPLARRLAAEGGVDLSRIQGSGPKGRIVKRDVEAAPKTGGARARSRPITRAPGELPPFKEIPNTNIRKVIAERLTQVHQEVPTFFLSIDCEIDALLSVRKQANEMLEDQKLSVNDFLIRAAALALMDVPGANSSWGEKAIRQYEAADISMAVATERGLITPIVRNAEAKTVREIAVEAKDLVARARKGKLRPEEFQGGTFTISNLGMFGIRQFDAVLNPPQACIMAVGAGEPRAVVRDGAVTTATMMSCTLTCDHRVVDGAVGAEFLAAFKRYVEEPARMLLKEAGYG